MKKCLARFTRGEVYHIVDGERIDGPTDCIAGDVSGIRGDVSGIEGDVSDIRGDVDNAELTDAERRAGIDINELIL